MENLTANSMVSDGSVSGPTLAMLERRKDKDEEKGPLGRLLFGDKLAQKNFPVGIQGVGENMQNFAHFGAELTGLFAGFGHDEPPEKSIIPLDNTFFQVFKSGKAAKRD